MNFRTVRGDSSNKYGSEEEEDISLSRSGATSLIDGGYKAAGGEEVDRKETR